MIMLLDVENNMFKLYGEKGLVNIPFNKISSLSNYISNTVLYVTSAIEVDINDIFNFAKENNLSSDEECEVKDSPKSIVSKEKYLVSKVRGTVYISEKIKFLGEFDFKLIDEEMITIIKNNSTLQNLIKNGKIEVIDEEKRTQIMKRYKEHTNKMIEKQKSIDNSLDSIILKKSVADWDGNIAGDNEHDAIEINIDGRGGSDAGGGVGKSYNTMSEMFKDIEGE